MNEMPNCMLDGQRCVLEGGKGNLIAKGEREKKIEDQTLGLFSFQRTSQWSRVCWGEVAFFTYYCNLLIVVAVTFHPISIVHILRQDF